MKGVIFREFLDFAEANMGVELVETAIDNVKEQLVSGGAYTTVGTYSHDEILILLTEMCTLANADSAPIVEQFGYHLFGVLGGSHTDMIKAYTGPIELLKALDGIIHKEVKKLYPEAELPKIVFEELGEGKMNIHYQSTRPFSGLAEGLLKGCFDHYNKIATIQRTELEPKNGTKAVFNIAMQKVV